MSEDAPELTAELVVDGVMPSQPVISPDGWPASSLRPGQGPHSGDDLTVITLTVSLIDQAGRFLPELVTSARLNGPIWHDIAQALAISPGEGRRRSGPGSPAADGARLSRDRQPAIPAVPPRYRAHQRGLGRPARTKDDRRGEDVPATGPDVAYCPGRLLQRQGHPPLSAGGLPTQLARRRGPGRRRRPVDAANLVRACLADGGQGSTPVMFEAENIRDWRGQDVVDSEGGKIGQLEAIYVDTGTDAPAFVSVRIGMVGRHRLTFVPLNGATVAPSHVRVAYSKKQVKDAMEIDTDGELAATDEPGLFEHYGLAYQPGASGERRLARR